MHMGGVDKNDQLRQYYHVRLKSRKFYRYIFWFLFEVCMANTYILHQHYSGAARQPLKEFRLEVARGLIGDYNSRKRAGRSSLPPTVLPLRHFPVKFTEGPEERWVRRRCWYCQNKHNRRRDTTWYCRDCQLHLCHTGIPTSDCFLKHHCPITFVYACVIMYVCLCVSVCLCMCVCCPDCQDLELVHFTLL